MCCLLQISANYENIHWQNIQVNKRKLKYSELKALFKPLRLFLMKSLLAVFIEPLENYV